MTYKVEMVEGLPQPIEPKWLQLRCKLDDMKVCLKPVKITLDSWNELAHARSSVYTWAKANGMQGKVHTTLGEEKNTLYVYMS